MIQKTLVRSALQLVCLGLVASLYLTAPVRAFEFSCEERAADCSQQCGTTVYTTITNTWCAQYWPGGGCMTWAHHYSFAYGSGIENFECDEVSEQSWCQCAY